MHRWPEVIWPLFFRFSSLLSSSELWLSLYEVSRKENYSHTSSGKFFPWGMHYAEFEKHGKTQKSVRIGKYECEMHINSQWCVYPSILNIMNKIEGIRTYLIHFENIDSSFIFMNKLKISRKVNTVYNYFFIDTPWNIFFLQMSFGIMETINFPFSFSGSLRRTFQAMRKKGQYNPYEHFNMICVPWFQFLQTYNRCK